MLLLILEIYVILIIQGGGGGERGKMKIIFILYKESIGLIIAQMILM